MQVPFVDLKKQYLSLKDEIDGAIESVINETAFIKGKYVSKFEEDYKQAYGVKNVISCANGTDAIYIALKSLGIGLGDEVITVSNTWISTAETISQAGAKPVFIDTNSSSYTINHELIERKITKKTKAIIPVHLYGQSCNMDFIQELCKNYNLYLIEDCAQAHFAEWNGKKVGTFGNVATFSFFPGKNLGAYGDAGAIITNDDNLANSMRMFANHGALKKHEHKIEGINSRLDGIQAAILSIKLPYIHSWSNLRLQNALYYNELLSDIHELKIPSINSSAKHVFHLYVVRANQRDELQKYLSESKIFTSIHYPTPLPFLKAYEYLKYSPGDFPVSFDHMDKILSLPMFPELSKSQIEYVAMKIKDFYK